MSLWSDPESRERRKPEAELPLFGQAHARKADPVHSHEAAASVTNLGRTREGILKILRLYGPCIDEKIELMYRGFQERGEFPMRRPSGIRSRRAELVRMGFVVEGGTGKTAAGRNCAIWRLA